MAKYIYKYSTGSPGTESESFLDEGAEVLAVGLQYDTRYLEDVVVFWAYCEDGVPAKPRRFITVGTDWEIPERAVHWGAARTSEGLVWHLLELPVED